MNFPKDLRYTKDHEWAKVEGTTVTVGVTDHAQSALGDIVFVDLPAVGKTLKVHDTMGVVESIKAVSDLYCPIEGKILEVNSALTQDPAVVNKDPYGGAWIAKIELTNPASLEGLMDAATYEKYVQSLT